MDKTDPPALHGVFEPVGHTVIAFRSEAEVLQAALRALLTQGFASNALARHTPAAMAAQVDTRGQAATPPASLGRNSM